MSNHIPMLKGDDYIEVHPLMVAQHKELGWMLTQPRRSETLEGSDLGEQIDGQDQPKRRGRSPKEVTHADSGA